MPSQVALLAEGVDRNHYSYYYSYNKYVALLAEGVDRNFHAYGDGGGFVCRPPRGGRG